MNQFMIVTKQAASLSIGRDVAGRALTIKISA